MVCGSRFSLPEALLPLRLRRCNSLNQPSLSSLIPLPPPRHLETPGPPCRRLAGPPPPSRRSSAPLFYYYHCCLISTFRVAASCPFFPSDRARVRLFAPVSRFHLFSSFLVGRAEGRGEFISNPKRLRDTVVDRELFPMCSELNGRFTLFRGFLSRSAAQTGPAEER